MHDFQKQCQNVFRAMVCEVSVISLGLGSTDNAHTVPWPWLFRMSQKPHPIIVFRIYYSSEIIENKNDDFLNFMSTAANDYIFGAQMTERPARFLADK